MNTKQIATAFGLTAVSLAFPLVGVFASDYGSYGSYNGPAPTDLTINKEVKNPISNIYVENLGSTDPTFSPGSTVSFRLNVKNGSGETMDVTLRDILPSYLSYVSASVPATYDANSKTVTMKLNQMIAGETRVIELGAKVADKTAFPQGRSFFCVTNDSKVSSQQRPEGDEDTASLCITTNVAGAQNLPVAGFEDVAAIIPFISVGAIGLLMTLKRK